VTRDEIKQLRDAYFQAKLALASGKSYTIGGRSLTRADERFIAAEFAKYDAMLAGVDAGRGGGVRVIRFMPRDL
jgi:hypothetical protein